MFINKKSINKNLKNKAESYLVSIVIPVYNEEDNINIAYHAVCEIFKSKPDYNFEFIFTDNHSKDKTFTLLTELANQDNRVKVMRFNRNYGFHKSLITAYRLATGDFVVQLDCDLQDPPSLILKFLDLWESGHDVVVGIRQHRQENYLLTLCRRFFYVLINNISDDNITKDAGDFRLIDRSVLERVIDLNDMNPYIRGLSSAFAINEIGIAYKRDKRQKGKSKFPFLSLFQLASDGVFSMTIFPLKLAGRISLIISIITIILAIYYLIMGLFFGSNWPSGFATLVLLLLFSISLNGAFMAILGKYLGNMYLQQQNRPLVIIEDAINVDFITKSDLKRYEYVKII